MIMTTTATEKQEIAGKDTMTRAGVGNDERYGDAPIDEVAKDVADRLLLSLEPLRSVKDAAVGSDLDDTTENLSSFTNTVDDFTSGHDHHEEREPLKRRNPRARILCDFYGLPNEDRPRREKILANARQLVNFLWWQVSRSSSTTENMSNNRKSPPPLADVIIVGCTDPAARAALEDRMYQLWKDESAKASNIPSSSLLLPFPSHLTFDDQPLGDFVDEAAFPSSSGTKESEEGGDATAAENGTYGGKSDIVYLSPDASEVLDISRPPPSTVIVGLIIDRRRIQVGRSLHRASDLKIPSARWPIESLQDESQQGDSETLILDKNEPLNVDCVMEGIQQWYWNVDLAASAGSPCNRAPFGSVARRNPNEDNDESNNSKICRSCFVEAASQALRHHQERHPGRPKHKKTN